MARLITQGLPSAIPAAGLPGHEAVLTIDDKGVQSASFTAKAVLGIINFYTVPTGGTITLPTAAGSRKQLMFAIYGNGVTLLSGTVNGLASLYVEGNQTLLITDADTTNGWV